MRSLFLLLLSLAVLTLLAGCAGTDLNARSVLAPQADAASLAEARRMDAIEALLAEGDLEGAERALEEGFATGLDHPRAHLLHGELLGRYQDEERLERAAAAYRQASAGSPRWPEPRIELADVLVRLGRLASADDAYARLAELFPKAAAGPYGQARVAWLRGRQAEAERHLDVARERQPDYPPLLLMEAAFAQRAGDRRAQETALHRYLAYDPGQPQAHFQLGELAESDGRLEDARRHWELSWQLRRDRDTARRLADLARRRGDANDAARWDARSR